MFDNDYPLADEIHSATLRLPISTFHTEDQVSRVIDVIYRFGIR